MHNVLLFRTFQKICTASSRFSPVSVRFFVLFCLRPICEISTPYLRRHASSGLDKVRQKSVRLGKQHFLYLLNFPISPAASRASLRKNAQKQYIIHPEIASGHARRGIRSKIVSGHVRRACPRKAQVSMLP